MCGLQSGTAPAQGLGFTKPRSAVGRVAALFFGLLALPALGVQGMTRAAVVLLVGSVMLLIASTQHAMHTKCRFHLEDTRN